MNADLRLEVTAVIRTSSGAVVTLTEKEITIEKRGERGGQGVRLTFSLQDWATINSTVKRQLRILDVRDRLIAELADLRDDDEEEDPASGSDSSPNRAEPMARP